jgi:hypothetical protein
VASGAAESKLGRKIEEKILSSFQNTGLGQNRVGRRNQLRQCKTGCAARNGELGRETERKNYT